MINRDQLPSLRADSKPAYQLCSIGSRPCKMATTTAQASQIPKPKIGGVTASGKPWTGGEPDALWIKSTRATPATAYCLRDPENIKLYKARIVPTDKKPLVFKRDDKKMSLKFFSDEVLRHVKTTGMDGVFYVPDPLAPTTMVNVITHHSKVTYDHVATYVKTLTNEKDPTKPSYDEYDIENLTDSCTYLENVIDIDLLHDLRAVSDETTSGPEFWMRLVSEVQSSSLERLRAIELKVRDKFVPSAYPNENIKLLVKDIREACHELEVSDVLPPDITYTIVNNLTKSSVDLFRHTFMNRRADVTKFLHRSRGKDKAVIAAMPDKITYKELCDEAQEEYQILLETKMWPPSANAGDKGDAPQALVAQVLKQLAQTSKPSTTAKPGSASSEALVCRYCKKNGHTKDDCLKLKKKNARENGKSTSSTPSQSAPTSTKTTTDDAWKTTAPTTGSPETINRDGKNWMWCSKCNSWRVSHGTAGHKTNEELAQQRTQQANVAVPTGGPNNGPLMMGW